MEAAVDDDAVQVLAGDAGGFDGDVRNVVSAVKEGLGGVFELVAGSKMDGVLGSEFGERFNGLVDGDELGAFDDSLAGFEIGVLAGYEDLVCVAALGKGVDYFAGKGVVAAHDGIGLADLIEMSVYEVVSELRFPVLAVVFQGDVHVVLGADGVEAGHNLRYVVVGFGAHDLDDRAAVRDLAADGVGHFFADGLVVERDVEVGVAVHYETVVADDRDVLVFGLFEDVGEGHGVSRDDDDRVDTDLDEVLDLGDLGGDVAACRLDVYFGAKFVCGRYENVTVSGPTLDYEGVERQADQELVVICCRCDFILLRRLASDAEKERADHYQ